MPSGKVAVRVDFGTHCDDGALELPDQHKVQAVLVSHAHMDHVRDLATIDAAGPVSGARYSERSLATIDR